MKTHNYYRALEKTMIAQKLNRGPGLHHVTVLHDEWCSFWKGGRCNCSPDIIQEKPKKSSEKA